MRGLISLFCLTLFMSNSSVMSVETLLSEHLRDLGITVNEISSEKKDVLVSQDHLQSLRRFFGNYDPVTFRFKELSLTSFLTLFSKEYHLNVINDAIDISGSKLNLDKIFIDNAGDKAISAGENSNVNGNNITIANCELGITSKDKSYYKIENVIIKNTKIGLLAFQKKTEFVSIIMRNGF